ncbi:chorismate mutase aro7 [Tilletia horrida]|uniref:chorismate mutase n=1 Tax=Tilletia horrida TaxID=155126 RepID=A0AAN6GBF7_9BASI|nr:chorismate mutase aro7 [Tilletia horrida]KAK0531464.1 chorismate mutase aro7 [Tilletia horrida]
MASTAEPSAEQLSQRRSSIPDGVIAQVNSRPTTFITANTPADTLLSLAYIRSVLIRLEDTICFLLIERAQFAHNPTMYIPQAIPELVQRENWTGSWLTWFLKESESTHAKVRRWEAPDEWPYTEAQLLPKPILPPIDYPHVLHPAAITLVNDRILHFYQSELVPGITARWGHKSDDGQYGSSAVVDVELLAALSRRIHFGMFVSESKFQSNPAAFIPHILAKPEPNRAALERLITKPEVEAALLVRLEQKAKVYGQDLDLDRTAPPSKPRSRQGSAANAHAVNSTSPLTTATTTTTTTVAIPAGRDPGPTSPNGAQETATIVAAGDPHPAAPPSAGSVPVFTSPFASSSSSIPPQQQQTASKPPAPVATKIDVNEVVKLYHKFVIPITKDVEVEYLVKRLDGLSQQEIDDLMNEEPA